MTASEALSLGGGAMPVCFAGRSPRPASWSSECTAAGAENPSARVTVS